MAPKAAKSGLKAVAAVETKDDESKKRKAEEAKVEESKAAAKEAKKEEPKEEEVKVEHEKDAPKDSRPAIKDNVTFDVHDCTLNVLPTMQGKVLMSLSDGGMQFLVAGARANVGIKSGRYMFEAKVIEALNPAEAAGNRAKVPLPRQLLRIGFSTAGSQLVLGESEEGVCFDAEGAYTADKQKKTLCQRFGKNQTMAVLLNLDSKSPNFNTISLFHNGERYCEPQPLPEGLKGKTLYPHVSYRNVSVQVNFGASALSPLPFQCRTLQTAAAADVEVVKSSLPKDGKYEVMFPVAFPDEGTFEWLDTYLEKNPQYVELSDRKIVEWAAKSGLTKPKGSSFKNSNDKPEFNYGLTAMDDLSVRRVLQAVAPFVPRNYCVMEVKENLTADDRKSALKRFSNPMYKKVAHVVMGEPNAAHKKLVQSRILKEKQDKAVADWKAKKAEKERKKQLEQRQKQLAEMRKKAEEAKKKAEAEKKKKAEEAKKKREAELKKKKAEAEKKKKADEKAKRKAAREKKAEEKVKKAEEKKTKAEERAKKKAEWKEGDDPLSESEAEEEKEESDVEMESEAEPEPVEEPEEETKEEEAKEEEKKEEEAKEEKAEDEKKEDEKEEEEEEEKEPPAVELTEEDKKTWFLKPAVGDLTSQALSAAFGKFTLPQKDEGFDELRYEWQPAAKANEYLRTWVLDRKKTAKMEDLKPSDWFTKKHAAFKKLLKEWQDKQKPFVEKKKKEDKEKKAKAAKGEEEEEVEEEKADDLDIFAIEDVTDAGNGEPLFVNFIFEDWSLFTLRYELFLLVHAFKHDVDDDERLGIHESNIAYYYNKYYNKQLIPKHYEKDSIKDVVDFIKDTVSIDSENSVLKTDIDGDADSIEIFVKLSEEGRRERQRRIDAGDETARIKFNPMLTQVTKPQVTRAATTPAAAAAGKSGVRPAAVGPAGFAAPGAAQWRPPAYGAKGMGKPGW